MIKEIFFDWHKKTDDGDFSFGQITFCDNDGNKLGVVNIDTEIEFEFKNIYRAFQYSSSNIRTEYNYI